MWNQEQQTYNEKHQKLYLCHWKILTTFKSHLGKGKFFTNTKFFDVAWQDLIDED